MKYININNKLSFLLNTISLFLLMPVNYSILIGEYPYLKKLNSKRYILLSSKGITFLDPTLTVSSNSIIFEEEAFSNQYTYDMYKSFSTSVVQFSKEDGNLILALLNDVLYVFDSNEILLNNITIIPNYKDNITMWKCYYLIPYKRFENNTFITFFLDVVDYENLFVYMTIQKLIYDYDRNIIQLTEKIIYNLENWNNIDYYAEIHGSISCALMNYYNSKFLSCLYGVNEFFKIFNLDPESNFTSKFEIIHNEYKENARIAFKYILLPWKNEVIYCTNMYFLTECIKYNIIFNNYTTFHNFSHGLYIWDIYCNAEYYEESKQIIFSFLGLRDNGDVLLIVLCL